MLLLETVEDIRGKDNGFSIRYKTELGREESKTTLYAKFEIHDSFGVANGADVSFVASYDRRADRG